MKKEIIALVLLFFFLFLFQKTKNISLAQEDLLWKGILEETVNYTPSSETHCINGKCWTALYSGTVFIKEKDGKWYTLLEISTVKWQDNAFNFSYKNYWVSIEPFVIYKGNFYTVQDIKNAFPDINIKDYIKPEKFAYKFVLNYSNVPQTLLNNVDYLGFRLKGAHGLTWDDVKKSGNHSIVIKNKVVVSYEDLIESNFTLNLVNKTYLLIGNIPKNGEIVLDPRIQLNETYPELKKLNYWNYKGFDKLDVEVNASYPKIRLWRWNKEDYLDIELLTKAKPLSKKMHSPKLTQEFSDFNVNLYPLWNFSENGAFEFEIILKQKPLTNKVTFNINDSGLEFYYQPPLNEEVNCSLEGCVACNATHCWDENGTITHYRPENVVGSYAVYHSYKKNNEYKTGKLFHIFRPKVRDSAGNTTWCDLHIDEAKGLLTITIPQEFLDKAVYPVTVDPTFGYESIGGSSTWSGVPAGSCFLCPESGTLISITVYTGFSINNVMGNAIYSGTCGNIGNKLIEDSGNVPISTGWNTNSNWETFSFEANTYYWLMAWFSGNTPYYYDTVETEQYSYRSDVTFEEWPDPFSPTGYKNRKMSIYANYTSADTTPPTYSQNSTNSTIAGTPVEHRLKWTDDTGLSGNPTEAWSNVTKVINDTVGCTIRWRVYANDTSNNWNVSEIFSYQTTYNPYLTDCSVLDQEGATYYLTTDIIDSSTSYCMNISANNVVLDCQGHLIDGDDVADYGIYVYRNSATTTNITIKNCTVRDWDTVGIFFKYANSNSLENLILTSNPDNGVYLYYSDSNTLTNITANSNSYGLYFSYADSNTLTNITANSNTRGLYFSYSDSNTLTNITANSNDYGLYLYYSDSTKIQDSTFKDNYCWDVWFDTTSDWKQEFDNVKGTEDKPIVYYNSSVTIENWYNNVSEIILGNADYSVLRNITMDRTGTENNGILLVEVDYSNLTDITVIDLEYGISLRRGSTINRIENITANSNDYGLYLYYSDSNTIKSSKFQSNSVYGIALYSAEANLIYNNLFNNTDNFYFSGTTYANNWNTTRQTGTRIYSDGTEIGGNYWTNSTGNGYSDTCTDADKDGFCDEPYTLATDNVDYLPLSDEYSAADTTPPTYSLNSTNSTYAGQPVEHRLKWSDNAGLSGFIFSFDNCTGTFVNDTWQAWSGNPTEAWSNVTKVINDTVGCTIRWRVYANDTSNNWNVSEIFSYQTTSAGVVITKEIGEEFNVYSNIKRNLNLSRSLSEPNIFILFLEKASHIFRTSPSYFNIFANIEKITGKIREISEAFSIANIVEKLEVITKTIYTDYFKVVIKRTNIYSERIPIRFRPISEFFNLMFNTERKSFLERTVFQIINLNTIVERFVKLFRKFAQPISILTSTTKLELEFRPLTQILDINTNLERSISLYRKIGETIGLKIITERFVKLFRSFVQPFSVFANTEKLEVVFRPTVQSFSINANIERTLSFYRKIGESFEPKAITERLTKIVRNIPQSFNIIDLVKRMKSMLRSVFEFFSFILNLKTIKTRTYPSVQYDIPYFTLAGSKDVKFYQVIEIDNSAGSSDLSIEITKTLPTGVDYWEVHEGTGCTGTLKASGSGNIATWTADSPAYTISNETICYKYEDGVTLHPINWTNYGTGTLSKQYVYTWLNFTENVGEDFVVSWNVSETITGADSCYENCTGTNVQANGGLSTKALAYGDWIPEEVGAYIQGSAEIMKKTSWERSIYLGNQFTNYLTVNVTVQVPDCYTALLGETWVEDPDGNNETIQMLSGMIAWIETLNSGYSGTWSVHFYTPIINVTRNETAIIAGVWYRWFDVNGTCIEIKNVKAYAPYNPEYTSIGLYDNTTGDMEDVSTDPSHAFYLNKTEYVAYWNIPSLSERNYVLVGRAVTCRLKQRTILNAPLRTLENVLWLEEIECENLRSVSTEYSEKWRIVFEARNIKLDDVPIEKKIDEYGAFVILSGSIEALGKVVRNLTYITDPVTAEWITSYPPDRDEVYYVDENAVVEMNLTVRSWTTIDINETITKEIPIIYGKDLKVWFNGTLYDEVSEVTGKYSLEIYGMEGNEMKEFFINFTIPTAESEVIFERPDPKTGLIVRVYKIKSITPYVLTEVHFVPEDIDYNETQKVEWFDTGNKIEFGEKDGHPDINLGAFAVGTEKTIAIYYGKVLPVTDPIRQMIEFLSRDIFIPIISVYLGRTFKVYELITLGIGAWGLIVFVYFFIKKKRLKLIRIPKIRKKAEISEKIE